MIKTTHLIFIFISFGSFAGRMALTALKPEILQNKIIKIAPHIIDTVLLISGVLLVVEGNWLDGEYGWIISKFILLLGYIALGVLAMRSSGITRWLAFIAAVSCYIVIFIVAITKNGFI